MSALKVQISMRILSSKFKFHHSLIKPQQGNAINNSCLIFVRSFSQHTLIPARICTNTSNWAKEHKAKPIQQSSAPHATLVETTSEAVHHIAEVSNHFELSYVRCS